MPTLPYHHHPPILSPFTAISILFFSAPAWQPLSWSGESQLLIPTWLPTSCENLSKFTNSCEAQSCPLSLHHGALRKRAITNMEGKAICRAKFLSAQKPPQPGHAALRSLIHMSSVPSASWRVGSVSSLSVSPAPHPEPHS